MKLAAVRRQAMALPEVTEEPHFNYASFRVRGKIFVTVPPDEDVIHVFVGEQDRELAVALDPEFLDNLFWGGKVVGLKVDLGRAKPSVVNQLVLKAWARKAPKKLADGLLSSAARKP